MPYARETSSLTVAYRTLGITEAATAEEIKVAYRQLALRHHPDKNPDNADATAKFQEISHAYDLIQKHLNRPERPTYSPGFSPFNPFEGHDRDDYYYSDDDDYYEDSDDEFAFYMYLFEEAMRNRFAGHQRFRREAEETRESPQAYSERLRRQREEQESAARRRAEEAQRRKERAERDRELERQAAEQRQKVKSAEKKAKADAQRRQAEQKVFNHSKMVQTTRSKVFAAARAGDAQRVKKGVWEENVDPTGGEVKADCQQFVKAMPKDNMETLLHIATKNGNNDLVQWLDAHSADPEERNAAGLTSFHVALCCGNIPIVTHFLETYPPKEPESENVYRMPEASSERTILSLAVESREPEVVYFVLQHKLAPPSSIKEARTWMRSPAGQKHMKPSTLSRNGIDKVDDIGTLLGKFAPPSPANCSREHPDSEKAPRPASNEASTPSSQSRKGSQPKQKSRGRGKGHGRRRA